MEQKSKKFIIIDSNSVIHRAYHALPRLTTKKEELVNAIYGFLLVFLKIIKEFQPDYLAACFDFPGLTFRHKKYKEYKIKRPPAPKELYQQIPKIKEILKLFNVPIFEKEGFEADDLIGTISKKSQKEQIFPPLEIIILSGDMDTLQLVDKNTKIYLLKKGVKKTILYDLDLVKEKYHGLTPEQIVDFKALRGDLSDNIPGVTGIGEKTALELLLKFGTIENLYQEIEENSEKIKEIKPKIKDLLLKYKEQAFFSKTLAQINKNVPLDFNLEKCRFGNYDRKKIIEIFKKYEFFSLIKRLSTFFETKKSVKIKTEKRKQKKLF